MRALKKVISVGLAAAMVTSLAAGCSSKQEDSGSDKEPVTIRFYST